MSPGHSPSVLTPIWTDEKVDNRGTTTGNRVADAK